MPEEINLPVEDDLHPLALANKKRFLFWVLFYSLIHIVVCRHLFVVAPPVGSTSYAVVVAWVLVGPAFYFTDLYLRQVWWPYKKEMARLGLELPNFNDQRHPYNVYQKVFGTMFAGPLLFAIGSSMQIWGGETIASTRMYPFLLPIVYLGTPAICFAIYHSCLYYKASVE